MLTTASALASNEASTLLESERPRLEILRTDTPAFRKWVEAGRNRREEWFHQAAGRIDISNLPLPTRWMEWGHGSGNPLGRSGQCPAAERDSPRFPDGGQ